MNADEKKTGAGSGGGPVVHHDDVRFVDGAFGRTADFVHFLTYPREATYRTGVALQAAGDAAFVQVQGERAVLIRTGAPGTDTHPIPRGVVDDCELILYAPCGRRLRIQRGECADPTSQSIEVTPEGIFIDGGSAGHVTLIAGPSTISITPHGITINGPIVKIN